MLCPYCQHGETKVLDSRESEESVRRRRECLECSKRFTTYERAEIIDLVVVKKDGRREPFDRVKMLKGVQTSCEKRPVKSIDIERMIDQIELTLRKQDKLEVGSQEIGELVLKKLKLMDKIAYLRFASVCKDFSDVSYFKKELKVLLKT